MYQPHSCSLYNDLLCPSHLVCSMIVLDVMTQLATLQTSRPQASQGADMRLIRLRMPFGECMVHITKSSSPAA